MTVRQGTQLPFEQTSSEGQAWPHVPLPPCPLVPPPPQPTPLPMTNMSAVIAKP
jgi:hypothetical protein